MVGCEIATRWLLSLKPIDSPANRDFTRMTLFHMARRYAQSFYANLTHQMAAQTAPQYYPEPVAPPAA